MMQIIRCSQMEKLTQELVDTFICDMFFMWRLVTQMMLTYNKVERENMVQRRHLWQSV